MTTLRTIDNYNRTTSTHTHKIPTRPLTAHSLIRSFHSTPTTFTFTCAPELYLNAHAQASSTGQDLLDVVIKHLNLLETSYFGLKYLLHPPAGVTSNTSATKCSPASATTTTGKSSKNNNSKQQQLDQQQAAAAYGSTSQLYGGTTTSAYGDYGYGDSTTGGATGARNLPPHLIEYNWLDVSKSALKQLRNVTPMTVYFGVKYYATDPCKLAEEITRYQFFLQCKQDILHSRLPVSFELAWELFAYAVQSELGDYDPQRHLEGYVSEFQFLPNQSLELEQRVQSLHRQLQGQVPATAELNFLERIKWLHMYGCELHPIQYDEPLVGGGGKAADGANYSECPPPVDEYALGLNPSGVLVLRNKQKVAAYLWHRIVKTKTQGRCFLMDVIDNSSSSNNIKNSNHHHQATADRNRFGFRLRDKEASRKLRWSIEEHKSFYHLIHNSTSLNQLTGGAGGANSLHRSNQQQQLQKQHLQLSSRFRNSIRSAINLGPFSNNHHNHSIRSHQHAAAAAAALAIQHQQQKLRSSMKSLSKQQAALVEQQYALEQQQQQATVATSGGAGDAANSRPQPSVVRMPSRRYSNRSLQRNHSSSGGGVAAALLPPLPVHFQQQPQLQQMVAPPVQGSLDSQQQHQQLMLMNQFQNQMAAAAQFQQQQHQQFFLQAGKSHTLKPISSTGKNKDGASGKKSNAAYYQMMMMAAAAAQQQQQQQQAGAEVSIVPPGRHIVQPTIYKATSVINGIDQLASTTADLLTVPPPSSAMMQFFNTRPVYNQHHHQRGHESPRSTKSAIAPSSALKLASKKLAKQQQQQQQNMFYQNSNHHLSYVQQQQQPFTQVVRQMNNNTTTNDAQQPLLAYDMNAQQHHQDQRQHYSLAPEYYAPHPSIMDGSRSGSPRSLRSARLAAHARHKSKSTNENLHLLHKQQQQQYLLPPPPPPALIPLDDAAIGIHHSGNQYKDNNNNNSSATKKQQQMLLATTTHMMQQQQQQQHMLPPPPNYHNSCNTSDMMMNNRQQRHLVDDDESELENNNNKFSHSQSIKRREAGSRKRATFAAPLELNKSSGLAPQFNADGNTGNLLNIPAHHRNNKHHHQQQSDADEDDYCCSRSDCSSVINDERLTSRQHQQQARTRRTSGSAMGQGGVVETSDFHVVQRANRAEQPIHANTTQYQQQQQHLRSVVEPTKQQGWEAIRQRHNEFSKGRGNFLPMNHSSSALSSNHQSNQNNNNNSSNQQPQLVKSIANKQATPILLSLNYDQSDANNKAVQLLNLQRQQLNNNNNNTSQIGSTSSDGNGTKSLSSSSVVDSAPSSSVSSSVASSPQAGHPPSQLNGGNLVAHNKKQTTISGAATESTASSTSTTTSGYYAGSNSIGSGSSVTDTSDRSPSTLNESQLEESRCTGVAIKTRSARLHSGPNYVLAQEETTGSRAKITLGSYANHIGSSGKLVIGSGSANLHNEQSNKTTSRFPGNTKQEQFYMAETNNNNSVNQCIEQDDRRQTSVSTQWKALNQIQEHAPSSLKYVSFDV